MTTNPSELFEEIGSMLDGLDDKIVDCKRAHSENFTGLVQDFNLDERQEEAEKSLNVMRVAFLAKLKASLEKRRNQLCSLNPTESEWKAFSAKVLLETAFTPMSSHNNSINIGCLVDLVYKNPFSIGQNVDYLDIYQRESRIDVRSLIQFESRAPIDFVLMPLSRNRLLFYNYAADELSILDSKLRVLLKRSALRGRNYKNIKVYGRRIVATGVTQVIRRQQTGSRVWLIQEFDVFLDVYDLNLRLRATKKFGLSRQGYGFHFKLERVSKDIFMHRYSADEEVYTLFDFELNQIVEHRTPLQTFYTGTPENMRTIFAPFFYDGEKVEKLTARHLYLLIHSPSDMAERKKRLLNLYTSQEIKWEHMQEANKIDGKFFEYKEKPRMFLVFNLDRDTFTYLRALNDPNLESGPDSYNWITNDEKYKGGLTEYGDLFSIGDDVRFKFI